MEAWGEFGSLRKLHDEFFSILGVHLELARSKPHVRRAVLQLFVVDSEVVRNLVELLTGENPEPEMLSREFPKQWFQRGRERIDHWDWSEILTRTRAIANDLAIPGKLGWTSFKGQPETALKPLAMLMYISEWTHNSLALRFTSACQLPRNVRRSSR